MSKFIRPAFNCRVKSQKIDTSSLEAGFFDNISLAFADGDNQMEKVASHAQQYIPGWKDVKVSSITVKDYSAFGGNLVFKVSREGAEPPAVAMRVDVGAEEGEESIPDARAGAIGYVLAKLSLAPAKIAHGANWDIEVWAGGGVAKDFSHFDDAIAPQEELAKLMASFHAVSVDWYKVFRDKMIKRVPFLSKIPNNAPFWNGGAYGWENGMLFTGGKMTPEKEARNHAIFNEMCSTGIMEDMITCKSFYPTSIAGKRVVTIHGDFKPNNIIYTGEKCMLIDYDFTHVSPAQQEFSFAYMKWLGPKHEDYAFRHKFLEMYLQSAGLSSDEKSIKDLMLDIEIGQICNFDGLLFSGLSREVPLLRKDGKDLLNMLAAYCDKVRSSTGLTMETIYNGLIPTMYVDSSGPLKVWLQEMRGLGSLAGFGLYQDENTWEEAVKVKAVRTPWIPF